MPDLAAESTVGERRLRRLVGTLRRDCLDHIMVFGDRHAERVLREYLRYYQGRPHGSLRNQPPAGARWLAPGRAATSRELTATQVLGGLHHRITDTASHPRTPPLVCNDRGFCGAARTCFPPTPSRCAARIARLDAAPLDLDTRRQLQAIDARLAEMSRALETGGSAARPILAGVLQGARLQVSPVTVNGARRWALSGWLPPGYLLGLAGGVATGGSVRAPPIGASAKRSA